jgi:hypothetical protein
MSASVMVIFRFFICLFLLALNSSIYALDNDQASSEIITMTGAAYGGDVWVLDINYPISKTITYVAGSIANGKNILNAANGFAAQINADPDALQILTALAVDSDEGYSAEVHLQMIEGVDGFDASVSVIENNDRELSVSITNNLNLDETDSDLGGLTDIGLSGIGTQYDIENTLNGNMSFSEDTLTVTNTSGIVDSVRSIHSISSGKHYWEVTAHCGPDTLGFETGVIASGGELHGSYSIGDIWSILSDGAMKNSPYYQVMTEGFLQTFEDDTFQVAVDMDNNKIYYGKNGLWLGGADPELSLNPAADDLSEEVYAFFWLGNRECSTLSATTNFGATQFKYDVPIGYFKGFCPSGECVIEGDSDGVDSDDGTHDSDDTNHNVTSAVLDIDANGSVDALTDGLIILRYLFGLRGQSLIDGVISEDAMRAEAADIETYIETLLP